MKIFSILITLLLINNKINSGEDTRKEVYLEEIVIKAKRAIPLEIIEHIKDYEKFVPYRYQLPGDVQTYIGYGHMILPTDNLPDTISEQLATKLLIKDFLRCRTANQYVKYLKENQILAITMLAYNCGPYKITKWSLWDSIQSNGDCSIWLNYCFFNGKKHKGLLKRRQFEYEYFKR